MSADLVDLSASQIQLDVDLQPLLQVRWHLSSSGYLQHSQLGYLHRLVAGAKPGFDVDHINGDKLDNRRANLRVCSRSENLCNRGRQSNNTSGYKGVYFCRDTGRWRAQVQFEGLVYRLGRYATPEEAHVAYCTAAARLHGEFFHA